LSVRDVPGKGCVSTTNQPMALYPRFGDGDSEDSERVLKDTIN
jgi:hypothetical protein